MFEETDLQVSQSAKIALISHILMTTSPLELLAASTQVNKETTPLASSNPSINSDNLKPVRTPKPKIHVSVFSSFSLRLISVALSSQYVSLHHMIPPHTP